MDWIKSYTSLPNHPKTIHLMRLLGVSLDEVLGKVHRLWYWASTYAEDGDLRPFGLRQVNVMLGLPPASKCLVTAKLLDTSPYLRIHDWYDHAGPGLQAKYKRTPEKWMRIKQLYETHIDHLRTSDVTVTQPLRNGIEVREEVRREEKRENITPKRARPQFSRPTQEEIKAYGASINFPLDAAYFFDYYEARGWQYKNGQPMKDWKAAVRYWRRSGHQTPMMRREPVRMPVKAPEPERPEPTHEEHLERHAVMVQFLKRCSSGEACELCRELKTRSETR